MISATRRGAMAGALALPAAASLAKSPKRKAGGTVLLHDPSLEAGRQFAASAQARGDKVIPIEGDRIRFARAVFDRAPALVIGVSRSADAVLIEDVGREVGYGPVKSGTEAMRDLLSGDKYSGPGLTWILAPRL
ncbi:MAG: hypothetical protein ACXWJC_01835 [Croceibacterium sp.]